MLSVEDIIDILAIKLIGVIPESDQVLAASNAGKPVIMNDDTDVSGAYKDCVDRLLGEEKPLRFIEVKSKGLLTRLFG